MRPVAHPTQAPSALRKTAPAQRFVERRVYPSGRTAFGWWIVDAHMPCPEQCPLRAPPSPPSPPASLSPSDIFFDPSIQCLLNASADSDACERSRRLLHAQHNVSTYTTCVGVRDACAVGERIVLGPGRSAEAKSLAALFEPLIRDYVWAQTSGQVSARGTFSAVDAQSDRYCSYNATISGRGDHARCTGDRDEGDGKGSRWIAVDRAATAASVWRAERRPFAVAWWPVYAPGFSEAFGNNVLPLHQLQAARWLPEDAELLPASSWFDYFYQPFSTRPLQTLQRLEQRAETRCYRTLAVCKLASNPSPNPNPKPNPNPNPNPKPQPQPQPQP